MRDLAILDVADRKLDDVPLAIQQRIEIGRALARDARVFLFDEPNSALTEEESTDLFRRMHLLADAGNVVLLVSHRIAELAEHADRVALILDGVCTDLLEGEALTPDGIAAGLVSGQAVHEPDEPAAARAEGAGDRPAAHRVDARRRGVRRDRPARAGRRDRVDRGRRRVGRARARALHRRVRTRRPARSRSARVPGLGGRGRDEPRVGRPPHQPLRQPHDRRQHGVPPGPGDHDRRLRAPPAADAAHRERAPRPVPRQGVLGAACRSARCRAATSRRSPSPLRS